MTNDEIIAAARDRYCIKSDDDIEIDDNPDLSHAEDGCWVAAWVWVPYPEPKEDDEDERTITGAHR